MKQIVLTAPAIDSFQLSDAPDPGPLSRGEVLVWMRAAALNFLDVAVATGVYPGVNYPIVPVADGAGEVVAVGDDVDTVKVGDRVAIHPKARWASGEASAIEATTMRGSSLPGSLREYAVVAASSLVRAPDHLSWEEIAALPIPATSAWRALRTAAISAGDTVVLLGTGVVALQALGLAKAAGARVIVTSSSDAKLERARALGADATINYARSPEWQQEVRALTDGVGADLVIETVGGDSVARSVAAVRQGGTVFTIGFIAGTTATLDLLALIVSGVRLIGSNTGSASELREAMAAIAQHGLRPTIAATLPVSDVAAAYRAATDADRLGKIAITLDW